MTRTSHRILPFALVMFACGAVAAAPAREAFVTGNAAAAAGDHGAAAADFERSLAADGWAAGTLFDLGNAYAGAGQRGKAILAYERAHLLAPRDAAIVANLARVREAAGIAAPEPPRLDRMIATVSADEWSVLALAGSTLACLGIVGLAWSIRRRLARYVAIAGGLVALCASAAAIDVGEPQNQAIVIAGDSARIAPFTAAEVSFTAVEGERVRIERQRGDFVYVRDADRTGWLPRASVEPIISGHPSAVGA